MTVTIALSIALPIFGGAAWLAMRARQPARAADTRGIALQTVIIIVVLLAIAGAVAGVLLTRGTEATNQLEETNVVRQAYEYGGSEALCEAAGHTWDGTKTDADGSTAATTDDKCQS